MTTSWKFDVSSFMVLLGESEEFNYRLMRRSLPECMSAAPVAGIQSYLHSPFTLVESVGSTYFSPYGCKNAPLRNMRLMHSIRAKKLLRDGKCTVYRIPMAKRPNTIRSKLAILWMIATWHVFAGIIVMLVLVDGTTWVGFSSCIIFSLWSVIIRLFDRYCMGLATLSTSRPDNLDAIFILGRRNSCFILEGRRGDIAQWTGQGLETRSGRLAEFLTGIMRAGSLAVILFIFIVIPNGSTWDQLAFIGVNVLGQANVMLGQELAAKSCLAELELDNKSSMPTRTHVYGYLLRKFGNGHWVDEAQLLPATEV